MEQIKFLLRLFGILFTPIVILVLSAIIWQNSDVIVEEFSLLGGWWTLKGLRLSSLLIWFLGFGILLILSLILLLYSEHKLRRELTELRQIKKQRSVASQASEKKSAHQAETGQKTFKPDQKPDPAQTGGKP